MHILKQSVVPNSQCDTWLGKGCKNQIGRSFHIPVQCAHFCLKIEKCAQESRVS